MKSTPKVPPVTPIPIKFPMSPRNIVDEIIVMAQHVLSKPGLGKFMIEKDGYRFSVEKISDQGSQK
jgi:hypothetical protein